LRVLGIDPGSRFMGYGVVEDRAGKLVHVGHGVLKADASAPLSARLHVLFGQLDTAVLLYQPEVVAVEGVFTFKNARSALILGHARGVALLVAAQRGLTVQEYPPAQVKRAVGAGGSAGKDAVARMVRTLLGVGELPRADASDALAVAICHLNHGRLGLPTKAASRKRAQGAFAQLSDRLSPSYRRAGAHG